MLRLKGGGWKMKGGDCITMKKLHGLGLVVDQELKETSISLVVRNAGGKSDSNIEVVSILQVRKMVLKIKDIEMPHIYLHA
mmetsp:Transcript_27624/g.35550  ORF Transcript_27624/g.35550 Transcript_27624/m.35550 type:complete len:81 (+) Transcript_27624:2-244(+)